MARKASAKQLAWRRKFAQMYGGKRKASRSRTGGSVAKRNGNGKRQGLVSWMTSAIALLIGFADPIMRAKEAMSDNIATGSKFQWFADALMGDYTGYCPGFYSESTGAGTMAVTGWYPNTFEARRLIRGYAPIAGAVAFKKGTSYLTKTARLTSLIPRIG